MTITEEYDYYPLLFKVFFLRVIIGGLSYGIEDKLRMEQAAYRREKETSGQVCICRTILEQSIEWRAPL